MSRKRQQPKWFDEYVPEEVSNSSLFKFTIEIKPATLTSQAQRIEVDMRADLDVDYTIIQDQLADTPSEFAYWGAIYSELKMRVALLERKVKTRRGVLADQAIKQAVAASVKLTDKQVQTIIEADRELNELEAKAILLNKHTGKAYFMVEAIRMKSDNIRSLAGFAKAEMSQSQ